MFLKLLKAESEDAQGVGELWGRLPCGLGGILVPILSFTSCKTLVKLFILSILNFVWDPFDYLRTISTGTQNHLCWNSKPVLLVPRCPLCFTSLTPHCLCLECSSTHAFVSLAAADTNWLTSHSQLFSLCCLPTTEARINYTLISQPQAQPVGQCNRVLVNAITGSPLQRFQVYSFLMKQKLTLSWLGSLSFCFSPWIRIYLELQ